MTRSGGPAALCATDLAARDELGRPIRLTADRACATAAPGRPADRPTGRPPLTGTFATGHAVLTWRHSGTVPLAEQE